MPYCWVLIIDFFRISVCLSLSLSLVSSRLVDVIRGNCVKRWRRRRIVILNFVESEWMDWFHLKGGRFGKWVHTFWRPWPVPGDSPLCVRVKLKGLDMWTGSGVGGDRTTPAGWFGRSLSCGLIYRHRGAKRLRKIADWISPSSGQLELLVVCVWVVLVGW